MSETFRVRMKGGEDLLVFADYVVEDGGDLIFYVWNGKQIQPFFGPPHEDSDEVARVLAHTYNYHIRVKNEVPAENVVREAVAS